MDIILDILGLTLTGCLKSQADVIGSGIEGLVLVLIGKQSKSYRLGHRGTNVE